MTEVVSGFYADAFNASNRLAQVKLNPAYRYLRVEVAGGNAALLVLGYVDTSMQGDVEVWYSSKGEVIKLQNGRIVGTAGLTTDWRNVSFSKAPPVWGSLPPNGVAFTRVHDETPGYKAAVAQALLLKRWTGLPPVPLASNLSVDTARTYDWFQEVQTDSDGQLLPPSWYAVATWNGRHAVVYSEQCLSVTLCLKLQRWPVERATK